VLARYPSHTKGRRSRRRSGARRAGDRTSGKEDLLSKKRHPDGAVAGGDQRPAARCYQLKTGRGLAGQYFRWTWGTAKCWRWPYQPIPENTCSSAARAGGGGGGGGAQ